MTRNELIELLKTLPENVPVVIDVNGSAMEFDDADFGKLVYWRPKGNKLILESVRDEVIFLGNIGDTEYQFEDYKKK